VITVADQEFCFLSALELRERFLRRELSPVEVLREVLHQIDVNDSALNAFVTCTPDLAMDQARKAEDCYVSGHVSRPLLGVPVSIKDIAFTKGIRTTRGSLLFRDFIPDFDSPVSERLHEAGAVLLGKTTTPEMGWKGDSGNRVNGPARNPWNPERTAGGSSGGAAVAVAAGFGPVAHGTDGAGSVRIPASFCGVYGIKPSFGLIPTFPPSTVPNLAHNGPLTRTVRDAALAMNVLAGPDARDKNSLGATGIDYLEVCDRPVAGLRIGWTSDLGYAPVEPEVRELAERAASVFERLGCIVEEVNPSLRDPWPELDLIWQVGQAVAYADDFAGVRDLLDPGRVPIIEKGLRADPISVAKANAFVMSYADQWRQFMEPYDLLLTPTLPVTAFKAGADHPGSVNGVEVGYLDWTKFTYPFNLTGQPAATVPCGFASDGMPVGLQIVGRWRDDATVLAASAAFEAAEPWHHLLPAFLSKLD
jgi:aspartyl-tRNA(Asn)/glutamyl-tRNA(Gln) amidotransferase subunit A